MEHIPIEGHFPHIGPHVADARLGHALLDQRQLLLGHHHMKMDGAAAFLCHRSSRSRLRQTRGGSFTLSSAFSRSGGWAGIGVLNTPESRRASWLAKSCSRFFSITITMPTASLSAQIGMKESRQTVAFLVKLDLRRKHTTTHGRRSRRLLPELKTV